jgi:hypothetical protein
MKNAGPGGPRPSVTKRAIQIFRRGGRDRVYPCPDFGTRESKSLYQEVFLSPVPCFSQSAYFTEQP